MDPKIAEMPVIRATTHGRDESEDPGDPVNPVSPVVQIIIYISDCAEGKDLQRSFYLHVLH